MSAFDPDSFLSSSVDGEMSTKLKPLPEDDYRAVIDKLEVKSFEKDGKSSTMLQVIWKILDEDKVTAAGRNNPMSVRQDIWLDLTSSGGLDNAEGKNVKLGRLRVAVGQNNPGAWSPNMLVGAAAFVHVGRRPDKSDPETIYNEVTKATQLSI